MEQEKRYCKCCKTLIIQEQPDCCLYQKVFNNFTGEFNTWDEIGDELIKQINGENKCQK